MGRRTALLVVAALVAALGASLVFMYVRNVDARASAEYDGVEVLRAVKVINAGEELAEAQSTGKIKLETVARGSVVDGALSTTTGMGDKVALTTVYPGEQIIEEKFGEPGDQDVLAIPDGKMAISVNLTDPARVAGFVQPGAEVAVFLSAQPEFWGSDDTGSTIKGPEFTKLLLPRVEVVGVGDTTVVSTTKTDEDTGEQTTEEVPRTLLTLAVDQKEAEKVIYASVNGDLAFALLTDKSTVKPGRGVTANSFL